MAKARRPCGLLRRYLKNTSGGWRTGQLLEVLECNRHTEGKHPLTFALAMHDCCCRASALLRHRRPPLRWRCLSVRSVTAERFAAHDKVGNRRLLWHGTNVAVVAAIINSGRRPSSRLSESMPTVSLCLYSAGPSPPLLSPLPLPLI